MYGGPTRRGKSNLRISQRNHLYLLVYYTNRPYKNRVIFLSYSYSILYIYPTHPYPIILSPRFPSEADKGGS